MAPLLYIKLQVNLKETPFTIERFKLAPLKLHYRRFVLPAMKNATKNVSVYEYGAIYRTIFKFSLNIASILVEKCGNETVKRNQDTGNISGSVSDSYSSRTCFFHV